MNSLDALRKMVDHYPGGRAAVAARLGKTDEVLRKELSGAASHKLGVVDAAAINEMCAEAHSEHCESLATSISAGAGGFVALPVREMGSQKQDLRTDMAQLLKECSDAVLVLTTALSDDAISDNELRVIQREVGELLSKSQDVLRGARENNSKTLRAVA